MLYCLHREVGAFLSGISLCDVALTHKELTVAKVDSNIYKETFAIYWYT